jgi:hypothetical protein
VEALDFCRPFEVFSVANRPNDPPAFRVRTVAEKAGPLDGLEATTPHGAINLLGQTAPRTTVHATAAS